MRIIASFLFAMLTILCPGAFLSFFKQRKVKNQLGKGVINEQFSEDQSY